jgi:hypothetical protein
MGAGYRGGRLRSALRAGTHLERDPKRDPYRDPNPRPRIPGSRQSRGFSHSWRIPQVVPHPKWLTRRAFRGDDAVIPTGTVTQGPEATKPPLHLETKTAMFPSAGPETAFRFSQRSSNLWGQVRIVGA